MKIIIDNDKCNNAIECKKCLDYCPVGVFMIYPKGGDKPFDSTPPNMYQVRPFFLRSCVLCMECVNKCPKKAISITHV